MGKLFRAATLLLGSILVSFNPKSTLIFKVEGLNLSASGELDLVLPVQLFPQENASLRLCDLTSGARGVQTWRDVGLMGRDIFSNSVCDESPIFLEPRFSPTPEFSTNWLQFKEGRALRAAAKKQPLLPSGHFLSDGLTIDFLIAPNPSDPTPRTETLFDFESFRIEIHYRQKRHGPILVVGKWSVEGGLEPVLEDEVCAGLPVLYTLSGRGQALALFRQGVLTALTTGLTAKDGARMFEAGTTMMIGAPDGGYTGALAYFATQRRGLFFGPYNEADWKTRTRGLLEDIGVRLTCLNGELDPGEGCDVSALEDLDQKYFDWTNPSTGTVSKRKVVTDNLDKPDTYSPFLPRLAPGTNTCDCTCSKGCTYFKEALARTNTTTSANLLERLTVFGEKNVGINSTVVISCAEGYTASVPAFATEVVKCEEGGEWEAVDLRCNKNCDVAQAAKAAGINFLDSRYKFSPSDIATSPSINDAQYFEVSCAPGFSPQQGATSPERVYCFEGVFERPTLYCAPSCPVPKLSSKYKITGEGTGQGATRSIKCAEGSSVAPGAPIEETIVCSDGTFSEVTMDCRLKCAAFSETLSSYELESFSITPSALITTASSQGTAAKVSCAPGYTAAPRTDGSSIAQPATVTCVEGVWPPPPFTCHKKCDPYADDATRYRWTPMETGKVPFGTRITVGCNYDPLKNLNYMLHAQSTQPTSEVIRCREQGEYAQRSIDCFEGCAAMPVFDSQRYKVHSSFLPDANGKESGSFPVRHGSSVEFECADGYSSDTLATLGRSTCHEGKWLNHDLKCKKSCPQFDFAGQEAKFHGLISFPSKPQGFQGHGTVINSVCSYGADLTAEQTVGLEHAICNDGEWSIVTVQCGNSCPEFDSRMEPAYKITGVGFEPGSIRRITCNTEQAFDRVRGPPEDVVFCANGTWSTPMIVCAKDCPAWVPPTPLTNYNVTWSTMPYGNITRQNVPHGEQIAYSCAQGYSPESTIIRKDGEEVSTCIEGTWSPLTIRCRQDCLSPKIAFDNTKLKIKILAYRGTDSQSSHHGTKLEISCKDHLSQEPPQILTCSDGIWPEVTLACLVKCRSWPTQTYAAMETPILTLPTGYTNPEILTPALVERAVSGKVFHDGSQIKLSCRPGFTNAYYLLTNYTEAERDTTTSCANGIWTDAPIACKANCLDIRKVYKESEYVISNTTNLFHGATATLSCKPGYTGGPYAPSNDTVTCIDGKWTPTILNCQSNCLPVPTPPPGYMVSPPTGALTHGSKRVIECVRHPRQQEFLNAKSEWEWGYHAPYLKFEGTNYAPENSEHFFCKDGTWSATSLMCLRKCPPYAEVDREVYRVYPDDYDETSNEPLDPNNDDHEILFAHGASRMLSCEHGYSHPLKSWDEAIRDFRWSALNFDHVECIDGTWGTKRLMCQRECLVADLPVLQNGRIISDLRDPNTLASREALPNTIEIEYECDRLYTQVPAAPELKRIRCHEGEWTTLGMECKKKCTYPSEIIAKAGKTRMDANPYQALYDHGSPVEISCRKYKKVQGRHANKPGVYDNMFEHERLEKETLTCVDGVWSTPTLQCRWDCPPFALETYPDDIHKPTDKFIVTLPQEMYWPVALNIAALKGMNLTFIRSEEIPEEEDAEIEVDEYGNIVAASIDQILPPTAAALLTAVNKWPKFEVYNAGRFHGSTRTVRCNEENGFYAYSDANVEGYIIDETRSASASQTTVQCVDGSWSRLFIQCYADCPLPITTVPNPEIFAFMPFAATRHGSKVTVSCRGDYGAVGNMQQAEMTCLDGRWTGVDIECDKNCMTYMHHIRENDPEVFDGCELTMEQIISNFKASSEDVVTTGAKGVAGITRATREEMPNGYSNPQCARKYKIYGNAMSKVSQTKITLQCADGYYPVIEADGRAGQNFQELRCQDGIWEARRLRCELPCLPYVPEVEVSSRDVSLSRWSVVDAWDATVWREPYKVTYPTAATYLNTSPTKGFTTTYYASRSKARIECVGPKWTPSSLNGGVITNAKGGTFQEVLCADGVWSYQNFFCQPSCLAAEMTNWAARANAVIQYRSPNGGVIRGDTWLPFGTLARVHCPGSRYMEPPQPSGFLELRCERGSFNAPEVLCMPACPTPSLPTRTWRGMQAWFLVDANPGTATRSGSAVRSMLGGILRHGVQFQLMCPHKTNYHNRRVNGGRSFRHRNSYFGAGWDFIDFRNPGGGKTSLNKISYDYECFNCRFEAGIQRTGTHKDVWRTGRPGYNLGPFYNVRCINGRWEYYNDFNCGSQARYYKRSKGSCVLCSHMWFQGLISDFAIAGDTQFGATAGKFFISGYHIWGPASTQISKMSRILSFMISNFGTLHASRAMTFFSGDSALDELAKIAGAESVDDIAIDIERDSWMNSLLDTLSLIYGIIVLIFMTPLTLVCAYGRQFFAQYGLVPEFGLYDFNYEESTIELALMLVLGSLPIWIMGSSYIWALFGLRRTYHRVKTMFVTPTSVVAPALVLEDIKEREAFFAINNNKQDEDKVNKEQQ